MECKKVFRFIIHDFIFTKTKTVTSRIVHFTFSLNHKPVNEKQANNLEEVINGDCNEQTSDLFELQ